MSHDGDYKFDDPWITGLVKELQTEVKQLKAQMAELAELRQLLAVYREQAESATGALNAEKHRADVAEQERDQLRQKIEDDIKWQNAWHAMTGE